MLGMLLFLGSLGMLFAATMLVYLLIRLGVWGSHKTPLFSLHLPWPLLLLSTAVVIGASVTVHLAVRAVQRERQGDLRRYLGITLALSVLFCIVQTPAMIGLLRDHDRARAPAAAAIDTGGGGGSQVSPRNDRDLEPNLAQAPQGNFLYAAVFFLVLVHAAHVLGGVAALAIVHHRARGGHYDHERHNPVKFSALYWHFLDGVWLFMFATLAVVR